MGDALIGKAVPSLVVRALRARDGLVKGLTVAIQVTPVSSCS
jgi:hypothetical protein